MRPGQNKRMRGRNNNNNGSSNRKGPNPLTRSYESNGPDVKIRGTAHHIGEKYLQLARDAQSSGDPVMAESYLQHAEHYFRLIASAQQAQAQAAYGYQRTAGEQAEADDDGDDDDFSSLPDRFASPAERVVTPPPPAPQPYVERPSYNGGGDRQPYDSRQDRGERYERPVQDRQMQDRQMQDRQSPDRQPAADRPYQDRQAQPDRRPDRYQDRNGRNDRPAYADRSFGDRNNPDRTSQDRPSQDRASQDRGAQDRGVQDRGAPEPDRAVSERTSPDRTAPNRDYDNRGPRNNRAPRDFRADAPSRDNAAPRENQPARQPDIEPVVNALPAFITTPVRIQQDPAAVNEPLLPGVNDAPPSAPEAGIDDGSFALRPRRRRRTKAEFAGDGDPTQAAAPDPVGD